MTTYYVVLQPISLDSGPVLHPAPDGDPPVLVDEALLFEQPSEFFTNDERAKILIDKGVIKPATATQTAKAERADAQSDKEP